MTSEQAASRKAQEHTSGDVAEGLWVLPVDWLWCFDAGTHKDCKRPSRFVIAPQVRWRSSIKSGGHVGMRTGVRAS